MESSNAQQQEESLGDPKVFSLKRMEKYVWVCADSKDAIPVETFCDLLDEIVMLLGSFGKAMYIAFSDVKDKSEVMRKNKAFMIENWGKP